MAVEHLPYRDEQSLSNTVEELGKRALKYGLISSFVVRHFVDSSQFYIPDEHRDPLTPEEAFMQLKTLLEASGH